MGCYSSSRNVESTVGFDPFLGSTDISGPLLLHHGEGTGDGPVTVSVDFIFQIYSTSQNNVLTDTNLTFSEEYGFGPSQVYLLLSTTYLRL